MGEFDHLIPADRRQAQPAGGGEFDHLIPADDDSSGSVSGAAKQFAHGLPVGLAEFGELLPGGAVIRAARAAGLPVPTMTEVVKGGLSAAGLDPGKPEGFVEGLGKTAGEFFGNPASYAGPGRVLPKIATTATAALGSEAAGQLTEGTEFEPWARLLGAVGGGMTPSALARGVTPLPVRNAADVERRRLNAVLEREGITASAGQVTGRRGLKYSESELGEAPGAGGLRQLHTEQVARDFTDAALRRIGVGRMRDEPLTQTLARAGDRIGQRFDTLAGRNRAAYDGRYTQDVLNAANEYEHLFLDPLRAPIVKNAVQHAVNHVMNNREMTGQVYQAVRSRIERIRRGSRDPEVNEFLADIRNAMDNLMERGIRQNNPRDLGAWREVRNQYRNLLPLERVGASGGEGGALGDISPARLRQAITRTDREKRQYARGQGDYADLVRAGNALLTELPQSGTGPRWFARAVPSAIGGLIGGLVGGIPGGAAGATVGALVGPAGAGRVLHSRPAQAYLKNQAATNAQRALRQSSPAQRALIAGGTSAVLNADDALRGPQ